LFLQKGQNHFYYLDKSPEKIITENGKSYNRNNLHIWGTKSCFKQEDLYTINIFNFSIDIIEKEFFGKIDTEGCKAFPIVINNLWSAGTLDTYKMFIDYLCTQKIRTPKGLKWIENSFIQSFIKNNPEFNQRRLMSLMGNLRKIYGVMWSEGVWEIISCNNSSIKFIISDHPVTTYNIALYPGSKYCQFPNDPPIKLNGTRTIFPLDMNHLLIISNRDYCLNPSSLAPLKERINARYMGSSLFGPLDIIRVREFTEKEVIAINYIIKERSIRYLAGAEKAWIFPEQYIDNTNWSRFDKILNPPKNKIKIYQETILGYDDGSIIGFDGYGRPIDVSSRMETINKILSMSRSNKE